VLLLDEPTNGVDPVSRRELWELLYTLVHDGMTLVVSTPYMDEAARCHRVGLLYAGALIAEGGPRELARQHGVAASNFEAVFLALVEKRTGGRAA
jgi:ABC-2 type transport system ATP-binding protein